jgi:hypothetical protein
MIPVDRGYGSNAPRRPYSTRVSRRQSVARRRIRKHRAARKRFESITSSEPWGSTPGELTPEERSRVLQRYATMGFRSFNVSIVPMFDVWFDGKTPEELTEAVRQTLVDDAKGKPKN